MDDIEYIGTEPDGSTIWRDRNSGDVWCEPEE